MGLSISLLLAASFAILCTYYIGDKILVIDFSAYRPQNLKKAKLERLLAKKDTPLRNSKIRKDIRKAFEGILIPLGKADQDLLPETCGDSFLQDRFLWGVGAVKKGAFLKLEGSFFIMRAGFCAF